MIRGKGRPFPYCEQYSKDGGVDAVAKPPLVGCANQEVVEQAGCLDKYDCLHIIQGDYLQVKGRHRSLPLRKPPFPQTSDVGVTHRGYPLYNRQTVFEGGPQK
jgi:hypothetical protein